MNYFQIKAKLPSDAAVDEGVTASHYLLRLANHLARKRLGPNFATLGFDVEFAAPFYRSAQEFLEGLTLDEVTRTVINITESKTGKPDAAARASNLLDILVQYCGQCASHEYRQEERTDIAVGGMRT